MVDFHSCAFCGHRFTEDQCVESCSRCSLFGKGGCHKIRCPQCGYESIPPPRLPGMIAGVVKRLTGSKKDTE